MKYLTYFLTAFLCLFDAAMGQTKPIAPPDCKNAPAFMYNLPGINPAKAALSTSEKRQKGLVVVELRSPADPNSPRDNSYQHPTWDDAGNLGAIVLDYEGNIFAIPAPMVSVLFNPQETQNVIYCVDGKTAEMKPFINLPHNAPNSGYNAANPYGLMGIFYDCDSHSLYATSVFGSNEQNEIGKIVHIDIKTKQILDEFPNIDPFGVATVRFAHEKRLFFGKARTSEVYSLAVDNNGNFVGQPRLEFSLENIGPRGDDRARIIKPLPNGDLQVSGLGFYYNLTAPAEKPETIYVFSYSVEQQRWLLRGFN